MSGELTVLLLFLRDVAGIDEGGVFFVGAGHGGIDGGAEAVEVFFHCSGGEVDVAEVIRGIREPIEAGFVGEEGGVVRAGDFYGEGHGLGRGAGERVIGREGERKAGEHGRILRP